MINETRKILNKPDLKITATAVRVPVFNSHSESINVELEKDFNLDELISCLKYAPSVIVQDDPSSNIYPLANYSCGNDEVFVGRIRRDFSVPYGVNLWVVSDNIRKGAATNAIQIVEKSLILKILINFLIVSSMNKFIFLSCINPNNKVNREIFGIFLFTYNSRLFYFKNPLIICSSASFSVSPRVINFINCSPAIFPIAAS